MPSIAFEQGIALFNQQHYFEAHEVWEQLWKQSEGGDKLFYQALIQCAIALAHMQRGNPRGARSLFRKCTAKLASLPRVHMGIDVWTLIQTTARALAPQVDPSRGSSPAAAPWPLITLSGH